MGAVAPPNAWVQGAGDRDLWCVGSGVGRFHSLRQIEDCSRAKAWENRCKDLRESLSRLRIGAIDVPNEMSIPARAN